MVLGISLPSIPLQGKKVGITVEHLACGIGDIQGKGHGNMGTKEPEGITSAMAAVVYSEFMKTTQIFIIWGLCLFSF